jgi:hypothetical protein
LRIRRLEDFGASVEGDQQAGDGSLGDFAQEGFQLGIDLFDRVHFGLYGGRHRSSAPAALMSCSTRGPFWLEKSSMTMMSPFESVGARPFLYPLLEQRPR